MKLTDAHKILLVTSILALVVSLISFGMGRAYVWLAQMSIDEHSAGDSFVIKRTASIGISGPEDLKTEHEKRLFEFLLWMNDKAHTEALIKRDLSKLFYNHGVFLLFVGSTNLFVWWKLRKEMQNISRQKDAR